MFKIFKIFLIVYFFNITPSYSLNKQFLNLEDTHLKYLLGSVSLEENDALKAYSYLNEIKELGEEHQNFNINFIRTLVELEKFGELFSFLNKQKNTLNFYDANLLLGLDSLVKKNYKDSEKFFEKLKFLKKSNYHDSILEELISNVMLGWLEASKQNKDEALRYFSQMPGNLNTLNLIQKTFAACYFEDQETETYFENLVLNSDRQFSRYYFFLSNYLLRKGLNEKAEKKIDEGIKQNNQNLLLNQTKEFFIKKDYKKIKNYFDCKNTKHQISEFFYLIANFYILDEDYIRSNFYLKLSNYFNKNFKLNKVLIAENYLKIKNYEISKNTYYSLKKIGQKTSWHSDKKISDIISNTENTQKSIIFIENAFKKLKSKNYVHFLEVGDIYKKNKIYEKSIEYYSNAIKLLPENHSLLPKILDRRGTSYERMGEWERADNDLELSLQFNPDQAYVLNYLAYSWLERKVNIEKSLKMLVKANSLYKNDPFIMDSLAWAMYLLNDFEESEKILKKVVQMMPSDPIVNDHYAEVLCKQKKYLQARYAWSYVLGLPTTEEKLKKEIQKKIIYCHDKSL
ncbi:MAG: hypothetical protein CBC24_05580 [Candidatus Pelagibacter sp. TMED64]|nr:hypothetical protein [Candidatus Pelagibacter sp.]OUU65352.1 MAG: hypothetical protein CBC24_05580 [Candidatus Pelagibacter sp. TMED64]